MPRTQTIADARRELDALMALYTARLDERRLIVGPGVADDPVFAYYSGYIEALERAITALT